MPATVLIPALKPSDSLLGVVDALAANPQVEAIIVINDGSPPEFDAVFQNAASRAKVTVLRHAVNLGKGAALRTGMNHFLCTASAQSVLVTADADGQHLPEDILAVATKAEAAPNELVLGSRAFSGDVPLRSRFGNDVTRSVFRLLVRQNITDTQTGLRAIPRALMPVLLKLRASGYEFELEMLVLAARNRIRISSVTIQTVYLDNNSSSHFNPLLDSMRIYFVFVRFLSSSAATALIDCVIFSSTFSLWHSIPWSMGVGRVIAGAFNFLVNRHYVFHSRAKLLRALMRYVVLVAALGVTAYAMVDFLVAHRGWNAYLAKISVEALMLLGNFLLQQHIVFAPRPMAPPDENGED